MLSHTQVRIQQEKESELELTKDKLPGFGKILSKEALFPGHERGIRGNHKAG